MTVETVARALAALREGQIEEAERLSRDLLSVAPAHPAAHQLAAVVALQQKRFSGAERWARSCLALRPDHAPAMMVAGRAARAVGDFASAKDWFRGLSRISPNAAEPLFHLGLVQIESADPEAPATLTTLAERFPGEAQGWREIGMALLGKGELEGAEQAFARAANASSDPAHRIDLGRVMLARGRAPEAVETLRRALAEAPDRLDALLPLAQGLRLIGAPSEARRHLLRLVEVQSDTAVVFYTLGLVCSDLRDWHGAIAAYRRCLEVNPLMPEALVNLGLALQQIGELAQAVDCYRKAFPLRPDTFGRIAQALPSTQKGMLWLDTRKLRRSLAR